MPKPPRPRQRKSDLETTKVSSKPVVAKPRNRKQLELFEPFPDWIAPCLPTLVKKPPEGSEWLHEIKWDGYRVSLYLNDGAVVIRTRNGHDWTARFPAIAEAMTALPIQSAIIDGEAVVLDQAGKSDYGELRSALGRRGGSTAIQLYAFDILYFDGHDLRDLPLEDRREVLAHILDLQKDKPGSILFSEDHDGSGADFFAAACKLGLEGIVSKRRELPYRSGRSESWLKTTCVMTDTFVIIGYQPGARGGLGTIHVATELADRLHYVGAVGTGFSEKVARTLKAQLDKLATASPIISKLRIAKAVWCRPDLKAEIAYRDVTRDGLLRHASFKGLA